MQGALVPLMSSRAGLLRKVPRLFPDDTGRRAQATNLVLNLEEDIAAVFLDWDDNELRATILERLGKARTRHATLPAVPSSPHHQTACAGAARSYAAAAALPLSPFPSFTPRAVFCHPPTSNPCAPALPLATSHCHHSTLRCYPGTGLGEHHVHCTIRISQSISLPGWGLDFTGLATTDVAGWGGWGRRSVPTCLRPTCTLQAQAMPCALLHCGRILQRARLSVPTFPHPHH
jgi:hypothetical protein